MLKAQDRWTDNAQVKYRAQGCSDRYRSGRRMRLRVVVGFTWGTFFPVGDYPGPPCNGCDSAAHRLRCWCTVTCRGSSDTAVHGQR